jgi:C-terminal processing protease CtpA/Prc
VVLQPDTATWRAGAVRASLARRDDGTYDVELSGPNYVRWQRHAHLHKRVLLRLDPGMWGKVFPVPPADSGLLDPTDPHRPTLVVRGGAVVVSMPSFDPAYKPALDSLVNANADLIRRSDLLLVDLRGDEGGSSYTSAVLAPYIVSRGRRPSPLVHRHAVMLSSPDQVTYAKVAFGSDTTAFVRSLVARMEASPGHFVPLDTASSAEDDPAIPPVFGPRRVGILIDRGTVSAAEVAVEFALQSTRAVVFGEPTAGALDYEQVNVVSLDPEEHRWLLGYPTITRDVSLPKGGIRGKGLQPDVRVRWESEADPIGYVIRALGR